MVLRLRLFLLFLGFFFLLSSIDVASRGLESMKDDILLQESADLGGSRMKWRREEEEERERVSEIRKVMEEDYPGTGANNHQEEEERERVSEIRKVMEEDYPGTGANNHHNPWTPGRS